MVTLFNCVSTNSLARKGKNVTEYACSFIGDGVQVQREETFTV